MRRTLAVWVVVFALTGVICADEPTLLSPVPTLDGDPAAAPGDAPCAIVAAPEPRKPAPPRVPEFFGDAAPISSLRTLPNGIISGRGPLYVPAARHFKISDNDSPRPQTRTYFTFNYVWDLNGDINRTLDNGLRRIRTHRETWGWEWANADGTASWGLRVPLNTFNAANDVPGLDGTSTDLGDLSFIFKRLLWRDEETGSLLSAGLAVTPPTAGGSFAGSAYLKVFHTTSLQPFCGWVWSRDRFYLQGFTAVDCPTTLSDVVLLSNSVSAGYFLYQNRDGVRAVVPTVEVHVNTPLNHRGVRPYTDPAGTPDSVHLTGGLNVEYSDNGSFGTAFAVPVTGPRLFDFQILAQFRTRY